MDSEDTKAYVRLKGEFSWYPEVGTMNICQWKTNNKYSTKHDGNFIYYLLNSIHYFKPPLIFQNHMWETQPYSSPGTFQYI